MTRFSWHMINYLGRIDHVDAYGTTQTISHEERRWRGDFRIATLHADEV